MRKTNSNILNRRSVVSLFFLFFAFLILGCLFVEYYAEQKVVVYNKSFASWRTAGYRSLTDDLRLPVDLFSFADNESITSKILSEETQACSQINSIAKKTDTNARLMPVLDRNILADFVPDYAAAAKKSQKRSEVMDKYYTGSRALLSDMKADCEWSIELATSRLSLSQKASQASGLRGIEFGKLDGDKVCQDKNGCVPGNAKNAREFAKSYQENEIKETDAIIVAFGEPCQKTTMKQLCDLYQKAWQDYRAKQMKLVAVINSGAADSDLRKAVEVLNDDKLAQNIFDQSVAKFPKLKSEPNVNKNNLTPETIFRVDAIERLASLKKQAAAIADI